MKLKEVMAFKIKARKMYEHQKTKRHDNCYKQCLKHCSVAHG